MSTLSSMTKAELAALLQTQNDLIEKLMSRTVAIEASLRDATTIPTVPTQTTPAQTVTETIAATPAPASARSNRRSRRAASRGTRRSATNGTPAFTEEQKSDRTIVSAIEGTVTHIAEHGKGLHLDNLPVWHNLVKEGAPIFLKLAIGQRVVLDLNPIGRVVQVRRAATATPATTTAPTVAVPAQTPAPVATAATTPPVASTGRLSKAGEVIPPCPFCAGPDHKKYSCDQVRSECARRQFVTATGKPSPSESDMGTMLDYLAWRTVTTVTVFSHNAAGFEVLPATTTAAPVQTPPADPAPVVTTVAANVKETAPTLAPEKPVKTAKPEFVPGRVYTGYIAQHATQTPGLIKLVTAEIPGPGGKGTWLQCVGDKLVAAIVKLAVNDKIVVEIGLMTPTTGKQTVCIVKAKRPADSSVASVSGVTPGVETSGRDAAPAPKPQATDPKVKAARKAARAASKTATATQTPATATPATAAGFECETCGTSTATMDAMMDHQYDAHPLVA